MLGPRITTVFRSKWRALWWALSVLAGVYFSVPRQGTPDESAQNVAAIVGPLTDQAEPAPPAHHVNPWAKNAARGDPVENGPADWDRR